MQWTHEIIAIHENFDPWKFCAIRYSLSNQSQVYSLCVLRCPHSVLVVSVTLVVLWNTKKGKSKALGWNWNHISLKKGRNWGQLFFTFMNTIVKLKLSFVLFHSSYIMDSVKTMYLFILRHIDYSSNIFSIIVRCSSPLQFYPKFTIHYAMF